MGVFLKTAASGSVELNRTHVAWAVLLLIVFGLLGYLAERSQMPVTTDNAWTAFQTILGVIVGFLGGEAHGRGHVK